MPPPLTPAFTLLRFADCRHAADAACLIYAAASALRAVATARYAHVTLPCYDAACCYAIWHIHTPAMSYITSRCRMILLLLMLRAMLMLPRGDSVAMMPMRMPPRAGAALPR